MKLNKQELEDLKIIALTMLFIFLYFGYIRGNNISNSK